MASMVDCDTLMLSCEAISDASIAFYDHSGMEVHVVCLHRKQAAAVDHTVAIGDGCCMVYGATVIYI